MGCVELFSQRCVCWRLAAVEQFFTSILLQLSFSSREVQLPEDEDPYCRASYPLQLTRGGGRSRTSPCLVSTVSNSQLPGSHFSLSPDFRCSPRGPVTRSATVIKQTRDDNLVGVINVGITRHKAFYSVRHYFINYYETWFYIILHIWQSLFWQGSHGCFSLTTGDSCCCSSGLSRICRVFYHR